ncbi:hypothetical protein Pmani_031774 [Petrolisthes manimaculis]|uniref:Uncharacterized protein n=1 Tax=Petrolisthes manimaculis TaxID=1843537 RepID=A0AAE1TUG6_9EUCA|nr:hypothetical protein Pmani_031774 [Petrolisthes manimaculis]
MSKGWCVVTRANCRLHKPKLPRPRSQALHQTPSRSVAQVASLWPSSSLLPPLHFCPLFTSTPFHSIPLHHHTS